MYFLILSSEIRETNYWHPRSEKILQQGKKFRRPKRTSKTVNNSKFSLASDDKIENDTNDQKSNSASSIVSVRQKIADKKNENEMSQLSQQSSKDRNDKACCIIL